jgi:hypothetical protein
VAAGGAGVPVHRGHWTVTGATRYGTVNLQRKAPQRRITDHYHPDLWATDQQHRFEDQLKDELQAMRAEIRSLSNRLLVVIGGLGLLAFALPIIAPFIRSLILGAF